MTSISNNYLVPIPNGNLYETSNLEEPTNGEISITHRTNSIGLKISRNQPEQSLEIKQLIKIVEQQTDTINKLDKKVEQLFEIVKKQTDIINKLHMPSPPPPPPPLPSSLRTKTKTQDSTLKDNNNIDGSKRNSDPTSSSNQPTVSTEEILKLAKAMQNRRAERTPSPEIPVDKNSIQEDAVKRPSDPMLLLTQPEVSQEEKNSLQKNSVERTSPSEIIINENSPNSLPRFNLRRTQSCRVKSHAEKRTLEKELSFADRKKMFEKA